MESTLSNCNSRNPNGASTRPTSGRRRQWARHATIARAGLGASPTPTPSSQPVRTEPSLLRAVPLCAPPVLARETSFEIPFSPHELGFPRDFSTHYQLTSNVPLGEGQFGVVYRGQHRASARNVAVKVMNKLRDDRTREDNLACIKHEVALWRACQPCKHVVRLEGVYEDERCVYLVQQLCTGGDLRTVLKSGRLSEAEAAQVMRCVLEVIHTCHTQHHVYGDCKPANFLLLHPHRAAGCQEFPIAPASPLPPTLPPPAPPPQSIIEQGSTCPPTFAARHTDTIREHLLASFQLPAVQGAASVPTATASKAAACPPAQGQAPLPPSFSLQQQQEQEGAATDNSSSGSSSGSSGDDVGLQLVDALRECADADPSWMSVLAGAQQLGMEQVATTPSSGQPQHQQLHHRVSAPARCGPKCHNEMVVLATDFGCCQPLHALHRRGVVGHRRPGSPVYMAPEMWQAGALVGPAVDVWAAGVMLYQLLSGQYPFWAMSQESIDDGGMQLYQVVCGIQSNPLHFSGEPWDKISRECKSLLAAMLERQPESRISARAALRHPWMARQLGYTPIPAARQDPANDSLDGGAKE